MMVWCEGRRQAGWDIRLGWLWRWRDLGFCCCTRAVSWRVRAMRQKLFLRAGPACGQLLLAWSRCVALGNE